MDQDEALALVSEALMTLPVVAGNASLAPITEVTRLFETVENGGLGIDSLDVIDAVMYVEQRLGTELDVDVSEISDGTVGELVAILRRLAPEPSAIPQ